MFARRYFTLDVPVAGWAKETRTFRSDADPVPFEHLGNHDCGTGVSDPPSLYSESLFTIIGGSLTPCIMHRPHRVRVHERDKGEDREERARHLGLRANNGFWLRKKEG